MERNYRFDFIRAIAILFVVCIHSMGLTKSYIESGDAVVRMTNALMGIIYCGVPLFVMLSGALLLGKEEPMKVFFKKRMSRVLRPFLVWSIIVGAILYIQEGGRSVGGYLLYELKSIATTGVHGIYWYVYMIIGLYCLTPILRHIIHSDRKTSGNAVLLYFCLLCLIVTVLGRALPKVQLLSHWMSLNLTMLFYFMAGWLLKEAVTNEYKAINYKRLFAILLPITYVINTVARYYGLDIPSITIIQSLSLFGIMITMPLPSVGMRTTVQTVSKYSYGIYLSHFLLVSAVVATGLHRCVPLWIEPLAMTVVVLVIDMAGLWVMDKTRLGKYVM